MKQEKLYYEEETYLGIKAIKPDNYQSAYETNRIIGATKYTT